MAQTSNGRTATTGSASASKSSDTDSIWLLGPSDVSVPLRLAEESGRRCGADEQIFRREDALVTLGVGKNMVSSIRHWGLATQILTDSDRGTHLQYLRLG